jgi:hypothetical protein
VPVTVPGTCSRRSCAINSSPVASGTRPQMVAESVI